MANAAGIAWQPIRLPIHCEGREIEGKVAIARSDTRAVLGVVSDGYGPVANVDALGWVDTLAPEGVRWETAGALDGGRRVWGLARIPGVGNVEHADGRVDEHRRYMLVSTSHDGSGSARILPTLVRVVCANTLSQAHREGRGTGLTVRHTRNVDATAKAAVTALRDSVSATATLADVARTLARRPFTRSDMTDFAVTLADRVLGPLEAKPTPRAITMRQDRIDVLVRLFSRGEGNRGADRYDALNAVTEWTDHHAPTRGGTVRIDSATFGALAAWKTAALDLLTV
jgi:phage/plasmid-like protein (TIGR03299 family)